MKRSAMILFLTIVLTIYSLACIYVFLSYKPVFQYFSIPVTIAAIIYFIILMLFVVGRFLERSVPAPWVFLMVKAGSYWLAALLYFVLFLAATDLLLLLVRITGILSPDLLMKFSIYLKTGIASLVVILVIAGYRHAMKPILRNYVLHTDKLPVGHPGYHIFFVSDVHLGSIRGQQSLQRLLTLVRQKEFDLVLFGGDTLDEDVAPVISQNLGKQLLSIQCKLGVYGIPGNHEYIGGIGPALDYLRSHGMTILTDESVKPDDHLLLIGRTDRDITRFTGYKRKALPDLIRNQQEKEFTILLDHQPFHLEEAANAGIDLQLSGHTHNGQLWPFNLITRKIYEVSAGTLMKGDTHFIVSAGFGTWGPPVRIGTTPEAWEIEIKPIVTRE